MTSQEKYDYIKKHPTVKIITKYNAVKSTSGHTFLEIYNYDRDFCFDKYYVNTVSVYFQEQNGWKSNSFSFYTRYDKDNLNSILEYMNDVVMLIDLTNSPDVISYNMPYKQDFFEYKGVKYIRLGNLYYTERRIKYAKEQNPIEFEKKVFIECNKAKRNVMMSEEELEKLWWLHNNGETLEDYCKHNKLNFNSYFVNLRHGMLVIPTEYEHDCEIFSLRHYSIEPYLYEGFETLNMKILKVNKIAKDEKVESSIDRLELIDSEFASYEIGLFYNQLESQIYDEYDVYDDGYYENYSNEDVLRDAFDGNVDAYLTWLND